jgi:hypothetical protein
VLFLWGSFVFGLICLVSYLGSCISFALLFEASPQSYGEYIASCSSTRWPRTDVGGRFVGSIAVF